MDIDVRPETADDVPAVSDLLAAAFGTDEEVDLVAALRSSPRFVEDLALVGNDAGTVVGYVLFSAVRIPGTRRPDAHLVLAPLAVAPGWQGQGVGTALTAEGLRRARTRGYGSVQLHGDPGFYRRLGFRRAAALGLENPLDLPDDDHRALELREGALAGAAGPVDYPAPFEEL